MNQDIEKALRTLLEGGIILYPTDTIWGLGCDATNDEAVKKIYSIKQREDHKSMLVLVDHESRLRQYINEVPEIAFDLIDVSDRPLTIIYPGAKNLAPALIADDGSVGIRITSDPFCHKLIQRFRKPIVSTSANISGDPAPSNFSDIANAIIDQADYVVNWRRDDLSRSGPSSIIKLDNAGHIQIIRK